MAMLRTCALVSVAVSTILLRLGAYIYLQWIPFHMLWPAVIFFWILFILSFILLLYMDLESPLEPTVTVETTDVIEVVSNGTEKTVIETEVEAVVVEQPRQATWMETIYLGIPNANPILSFITIAMNAGMLMMTLDLTFRTYLFYPATDLMFHRPIPTSPFSANIFIRCPPESPLPVRLFYKPVDVTRWETGPVAYEFDNSTDFTSVVTLDGLAPSTPYNYAVLPPDMNIDTANSSSFGSFETFPHHGKNGRWSFGSSSCILPHVPYNPLDDPLHIQGLEYLEKDMPSLKFFTFLGPLHFLNLANLQVTLFTLTSLINLTPLQSPSFCNTVKSTLRHHSRHFCPIFPFTTSTTTTTYPTTMTKVLILLSTRTHPQLIMRTTVPRTRPPHIQTPITFGWTTGIPVSFS